MEAITSMLVILLGTLIVTAAAGGVEGDPRAERESQLRNQLFGSYHKEVLPQSFNRITIDGMDINSLEMYEAEHRMDLHVWITLRWEDPRLRWDAEANNISKIHVTPDSLWKPDLTIYSGGDPSRALLSNQFQQYLMIVYSNGSILTVPSIKLHFGCIMDLTYWPHDSHTCKMKIGSWVHDGYTLDLQADFTPTMNELNTKDGWAGEVGESEWTITPATVKRNSATYDCCPEPYVDIEFTFILTRVAPAYSWLIRTPVMCLVLVSVVVFVVPVTQTGVKLLFGGLLIVSHLIFLTLMSSTVYHNPSHTPLLVKLVVVELVVVVVSVIVSGVVSRLAHSPHSEPPSPLVKRVAMSLSYVLCLQTYTRQASGLGGGVKPDEVELGNDTAGSDVGGSGGMLVGEGSMNNSTAVKKGSVVACQWVLVGAMLDRLAFLCYLVATLAVVIAFCSIS